ncbi:Proteasome assembly chaperone 4 [Cinara cedri]|uniref:Proteasome assembly chaperone 4 n=1 Tax=Cinara cedri TaxID=506608 RepID=A0A5E4NGE0_9HEMI|nr:Proteasome assembly chaperone 4 [Cinara cedri]
MEMPTKCKRDMATIEYVEPKTKSFTFTSTVLGVCLYNHIMRFDNCIFVVISQDNTFSSLSVAMTQRNSTNTIASTIFNRDPDNRSESIANLLIKSLKIPVPIYVSFNAKIENAGLKCVISSLIANFKSHPDLIDIFV